MKLKVGLVGASGRMGKETQELLSGDRRFNPDTELIDKKIGSKNLKIDVIIDFSSPEGLSEALEIGIKNKIPVVSGTTGLSPKEQKELKLAASKIPVFWAPNLSLGIAVLRKALQSFSSLKGFDFQIEETHHNQKKDKPSGTAILLQKDLQKVVNTTLPEPLSIRGGGVYGIHHIHAMSNEEALCFSHEALNRKVFARGAIEAAIWIVNQRPGLYNMDDLLSEK